MEITAAMVKALRDKTGSPMMECKNALTEAGGDPDAAIEVLRKKGASKMMKMADREAAEGRIACFVDAEKGRAGIVELRCETAPVANTDDFINLARTIAQQVAATESPDAATIREQALPGNASRKVGDRMDEVFNRIRENMKIARVAQFHGHVGSYVHHNSQVGVLVEMNQPCSNELKADICMHIAALAPPYLRREDVDPQEVAAQRAVFAEEAKGKPPQIVDKIVGGKLNRWFAEFVLLEQPFVKDDKKSVGEVLKGAAPDLTVTRFVRYEVGRI